MKDIFSTYKKPIFSGIIIGITVLAILLILSDVRGVMKVFSEFRLQYLPLILILAPLNYLFRFMKWNYYLRVAGLKPEPRMNKYIFMSGLSMTITPGKVGELLKCYLLKEHMGAPISTTSSIVMAERITDGIAMVILASFGSLAYAYGGYVLLFSAAALFLVIILFQMDIFFNYVTEVLGRYRYFERITSFLLTFQRSAKKLFTLQGLVIAVGIGLVSWGFEGFVIFLAVRAFGGDITILNSIFAVSISSILGAVSTLPGGIGVTEGSIMAILLLIGLNAELAAATTVVTRFSTLWLGVAVGVVGLFLTQRELNVKVGPHGNSENNDHS